METVELTWWRVTRFWWAALWRGLIYANLFAGAFAAIVGVALAVLGHRYLGPSESRWFLDSLWVAALPAFVFGTRSALRLPYRDFRIILIPPDARP